jgi:glutathione S-transferase
MLRLISGNRNYSSWSMRAWLVLKLAKLEFEETVIRLAIEQWGDAVRALGGQAGKVPVLLDDDFAIWDSLAIAEYVYERSEEAWPKDPKDRARARSIAAEIHAGFLGIRTAMPCNIRGRHLEHYADDRLDREIYRVEEIWAGARGLFLFGDFSVADIFFAPVATRFQTYDIELKSAAALAYQDRLLSYSLVRQWCELALKEPEEPKYELPRRTTTACT